MYEYELRLGIKSGGSVSSNIGKSVHQKLLTLLDASDTLVKTESVGTDIYYDGMIRMNKETQTDLTRSISLSWRIWHETIEM